MRPADGALAVVGDLVEDVVVWLDGPLRHGSDTPSRVFRLRGGSAANVAVAAAPLVRTRFLGCVGADPLGDRLVQQLAAAGVDVRASTCGRSAGAVRAASSCSSTRTASGRSCSAPGRSPSATSR